MSILVKSQKSRTGVLTRIYETAAGLWFPLWDLVVPKHMNILAMLKTARGIEIIPGHNIVTSVGDVHYAQRAVSESLTNAFGIGELASAGSTGKGKIRSDFTVIGSTQKAHTATYPKRNDGDTDNTGAGTTVVTFLQTYTKADFTAASITHGIITNTSPGAGEPLLTGYAFAATFGKTANDTLKIFQNHTMLGV